MTRFKPAVAACTLGEGDYHYGTGALANSLHASGFRDNLYVGYRGELPSWAGGQKQLDLPEGMRVFFVPLQGDRNLNFEKSALMRYVLDNDAAHDAVAYFDSDVIVRAEWSFFREWSRRGVGLCMDQVWLVPDGHPWRAAWQDLATEMGLDTRPLNYYCNAGFALVPRGHEDFLAAWARAVDAVLALLADETPARLHKYGDIAAPFHRSDQDALAIAMMTTDVPLSLVGPDGMSFTTGANLMTHAINKPKPWQRRYLRDAISGVPPVLPERQYWRHVATPIALFPKRRAGTTVLTLKAATTIGSIFRRPRFWAAG